MKGKGKIVQKQTMELHGITIYLLRKNIKNQYIRLRPDGGVQVSVPSYFPDNAIAEFLEKHWQWIEENRGVQKELEYVTGEVHDLWGTPYELLVERSLKRALTEVRGEQIYMRVPAKSTDVERRKQLDLFYKQELQRRLPEIASHYEKIVGKKAAEWRFRRMKSRWGSCQIQKRRICLNLQLAEKPVECLEYVVVHELTHLHEPSHNQRFWSLVDQFYPEWKKQKKKLNAR